MLLYGCYAILYGSHLIIYVYIIYTDRMLPTPTPNSTKQTLTAVVLPQAVSLVMRTRCVQPMETVNPANASKASVLVSPPVDPTLPPSLSSPLSLLVLLLLLLPFCSKPDGFERFSVVCLVTWFSKNNYLLSTWFSCQFSLASVNKHSFKSSM